MEDPFVPVSGGRSSEPEFINTFAPSNKLTEIPHDFAVEYLITLENLAAYNSDISYALDNIVQLANTNHIIEFPDGISDVQKNKMKAHLKSVEKNWYANGSGTRSLKGDLLTQIVINGALSAEIVPNIKLKGIEQVFRVSPKNIVFVYDPLTGAYLPYQKSKRGTKKGNVPGLIELNTLTYKYIALRRYFQSPYATPPFISAIDSIVTQKDMMANFKNIMQKLGMLGFLTAEVTEPQKLPGEDPQAYWNRCLDYLNNVVYPQLDKNLSKGMVAGFKDKHKFTLQGNNMNVSGADGLFNLIQSRIFAGVKQDPNMNGVQLTTTETFGRVILAKLLSQIDEYQSVVDSFFSSLYLMELRLAGYKLDFVEVKSEKPTVNDKVKDEEAESKKIDNVIKKVNAGIISNDTAAQELGYEKAEFEQALSNANANKSNPSSDNRTDPSGGSSNQKMKKLLKKFNKSIPTYDYGTSINCGKHDNGSFSNAKYDEFKSEYFDRVNSLFKKSNKNITQSLGNKLLKMSKTAPVGDVQREVYLHLLKKWESEFVDETKIITKNNISKIYINFRSDKKIFSKNSSTTSNSFKTSEDIPTAVLNLDDYRTITYMEQSDQLYLGKFITDKDSKKKLYDFIQKKYIEEGLPIGNNTTELSNFRDDFEELINLESWKIRRIIDTTVNKIRNYANVSYLDQAAVDTFEINEINDNLTCQWCTEMDGKQFSVADAKAKIKAEVSAGPENVSKTSPFLTSIKIDEIKGKTSDELSALGFGPPPYHSHCRGFITAVF